QYKYIYGIRSACQAIFIGFGCNYIPGIFPWINKRILLIGVRYATERAAYHRPFPVSTTCYIKWVWLTRANGIPIRSCYYSIPYLDINRECEVEQYAGGLTCRIPYQQNDLVETNILF